MPSAGSSRSISGTQENRWIGRVLKRLPLLGLVYLREYKETVERTVEFDLIWCCYDHSMSEHSAVSRPTGVISNTVSGRMRLALILWGPMKLQRRFIYITFKTQTRSPTPRVCVSLLMNRCRGLLFMTTLKLSCVCPVSVVGISDVSMAS